MYSYTQTKFSTQFSRDRSSLAQRYRMAHVTLVVTTTVTRHQNLVNSNLGTPPFRESATETVVRILVHGSQAMLSPVRIACSGQSLINTIRMYLNMLMKLMKKLTLWFTGSRSPSSYLRRFVAAG